MSCTSEYKEYKRFLLLILFGSSGEKVIEFILKVFFLTVVLTLMAFNLYRVALLFYPTDLDIYLQNKIKHYTIFEIKYQIHHE